MKINPNYIVIVLIVALGALYFNVSLNSPVIFGDEAFHASVARWTAENGIIPVYHPTAQTEMAHVNFFQRSTFLAQETFAWMVAGDTGLRLLFPIFSILGAFMVYVFLRRFDNPYAGVAAALIFMATPSLITYGVLGYVDTMFVLLSVCFVHFSYTALKDNNKIHMLLSGIFLGMAFLTKASAPFLLIFLFLDPWPVAGWLM